MLHYYRWRTVKKLISDGVHWEDVYDEASDVLSGTQFRCGGDMIKKSYSDVENDMRDRKRALLYYTAMKETRFFTGTQLVPT